MRGCAHRSRPVDGETDTSCKRSEVSRTFHTLSWHSAVRAKIHSAQRQPMQYGHDVERTSPALCFLQESESLDEHFSTIRLLYVTDSLPRVTHHTFQTDKRPLIQKSS